MQSRNFQMARFLITALVLFCSTALADPGDDVQTGPLSKATAVGRSNGGGSSLWNDPNNSGVVSQSVNLYTGQHVESFPLMSISGRDGYGASTSLDYNGNVFVQAKQENYRAQASPFGLGFSLGGESIVADHRGTVDIDDDEYRLVLNNTSMGLKKREDAANSYVTESGEPWVITRTTGIVDSVSCVIGWTIKKEDGLIYRFGDGTTTPSTWNATRNILSYGTYVGNGITTDDKIYPTHWDLKVIHDPDSLHWVTFTYLRDLRQLKVGFSDGAIDTSDHRYVSASYLSSVQTDDGRKLELTYSAREDADTVLGYNNYEFFFSKKCDMLVEKSSAGIVSQKLKFAYDYLNASKLTNLGSPFKKLLLTSITKWTPDGSTESLPPILFEYFLDDEDAQFGAMHRIYYPSGAIKEISHETVAPSSNFARLDGQLLDMVQAPTPSWYSDGICVTHPTGTNQWKIAIWDGYWHVSTISASSEVNDRPGILPNQCVVIPGNTNELITLRWRGGYWDQDTISNEYTRGGYQVFLYPGQDCFLMVLGTWSPETGTRHRLSKYFQWDNGSWRSNNMADTYEGNYLMCGARMRNSMIIMSLFDLDHHYVDLHTAHYTHVNFGRYLDSTSFVDGSFTYETAEIGTSYEYDMKGNIFIGHDYVGCMGSRYLYANRWKSDDSSWTSFQPISGDLPWRAKSMTELPNGVAWSYVRGEDGKRSHLDVLVPSTSASGFTRHEQWASYPDTANMFVSGLWGSSTCLAHWFGRENDHRLYLGKWDGNSYVPRYITTTDMADRHFDLYDHSWTIGPYAGKWGQLSAKALPFLGGATGWLNDTTDIIGLNTSEYGRSGMTSSERSVLCHVGDSLMLFRYDLFRNGQEYQPNLLLTKPTGYYGMYSWLACSDQFAAIRPEFKETDTSSLKEASVKVYATFGSSISGDAPYLVVSSVTTKQHKDDATPIVVNYTYDGGLLDRSITTPRFAKVTESTPHFADSAADGHVVHCFHNDIDNAGFVNDSIYTGRTFPDLDDSTRYGIADGGYHLDGMEYLTYSYTGATEPTNTMLDESRSFFSLYHPIDYPSEVYRTRLDSVNTRKDSLASHIEYVYDQFNHQVVTTRTRYVNDTSYFQDSTVFAYKLDSATMCTDNAITQAAEQIRTVTLNDTTTLLSKSRTDLTRKGNWLPRRSYTYRTLTPSPANPIYGDTLLAGDQSFDSRGNIIVTKGPGGLLKSTKFDALGNRPVASAVGCAPASFVVQDFEQPTTWDGWVVPANTHKGRISSVRHTGYFAYRLLDTTGTGINIGPSRLLSGSDVSDFNYQCSFWTRASDTLRIDLWKFFGTTDSTLTSQLVKTTGIASWRKVEVTFDVQEIKGNSNRSMRLVLAMTNGASTDTAYFDDVRFVPVHAVVSTTVYDTVTAATTAGAGSDNIPKRTVFDLLQRPIASFNAFGDTLSKTEYYTAPNIVIAGCADSLLTNEDDESSTKSWIVGTDQFVSYSLRVDEEYTSPQGTSKIYLNSIRIDSIKGNGSTVVSRSGNFAALAGDTIRITLTRPYTPGGGQFFAPPEVREVWASASGVAAGYEPESPSYVKRTSFAHTVSSNGQATIANRAVSISFVDPYGRSLQTRLRDSIGGAERAIVSGIATYDARGRKLRTFKPYRDLFGTTGVSDFALPSECIVEVDSFYNGGVDRGSDCQHKPFSEVDYAVDVNSRIDSAGAPGAALGFGSTRTSKSTSASVISGTDSPYVVAASVDPDGLVDTSKGDQWGRWSRKINHYESNGISKQIVLKTTSDLLGRLEQVSLDTGGPAHIPLRVTHSNTLGKPDSTWKVDYGTVRMLYDKQGNLRYMQNDIRKAESTTVYFKYDNMGRKIEEGTTFAAKYFYQDSADAPLTPEIFYSTVQYKWIYDYWKSGSTTLSAPGRLVRVQNADGSYYRNFYYDPSGEGDSVVVKLPQSASAKKKMIRHIYDRNGSLAKLIVQPDSAITTTAKVFKYVYDQTGRLKSVMRSGLISDFMDTLTYVSYEYNPDGSVKEAVYGRFDTDDVEGIPPNPYHGQMQAVKYQYSPEGRLLGMNDVEFVQAVDTGNVDHFASQFDYYPDNDSIKYYNGRVRYGSTANSSNNGVVRYDWQYTYNDLGWLMYADDTLHGNTWDQRFIYNSLGQRTKVITGGGADTVNYVYNTTVAGSSKLKFMTGYTDSMTYDILGNLTSDRSHGVYNLYYDYRNLLVNSYSAPNLVGGANTNVVCVYDETGQRIKKGYSYNYMAECPPPEELLMGGEESIVVEDTLPPIPQAGESEGMGGEGVVNSIGGGQCMYTAAAAEYYLYDGGVLLATFDHTDKVIDMFVNSPTGRIASYYQNKDTSLYFFLNDQVGSTRLVMKYREKADASQNHYVAQFYNYQPFGEVIQSWGSYPTAFKFSSKEHDKHGGFDYVYFGARYYDPRLGQFSSIDAASQYASGYVYGNNNPIMGVDPDGNWFWAAVQLGLKLYYVGKSTVEGYKSGGLLGAIKNYYISSATALVADKVSAAVKPATAIGSIAASSATYSAGNIAMNGRGDFAVNFGIGQWNMSKGGWHWADFQGNVLSDAGTIAGWGAAASDFGKWQSYVHLSPKQRADLARLKEKYSEAKRSFVDGYPGEKYGGVEISNADFETLDKIGERLYHHFSPLDPTSIPGIRWIRNQFGKVGPSIVEKSVHVTGHRFPNGLVVSTDIDNVNRVHNSIYTMSFVGAMGHYLENDVFAQAKQAMVGAYATGELYSRIY